MNTMFKRIATTAMAMALAANIGGLSAFAAGPEAMENGKYEATVHCYKENTQEFIPDNRSMSDALFAHTADLTLTDDSAVLDIYVASPVPGFPDQGADGTVKNVYATIGGQKYQAASDMETKAVKTFDVTNPMFGINAGDQLTTQKLTFTLPRAALADLQKGVNTSAFVNVVMMTDVILVMHVSDIKPASGSVPTPTPTVPSEQSQKSTNITADIASPEASYIVTIPENVSMGTLSATEDNSYAYDVEVTASNMGSGYLEISAAASGNLVNGKNNLPFANSFGKQTVSHDDTLHGAFSVTAADVKDAVSGNYTGIANFTIQYFAGK